MGPLKLYHCTDSPPSLAVRMTLKYLGIEPELIEIDFANGEHISDDFKQKYPQGEIPLLDDDGFYLGESIAIHQYVADKFAIDDKLYPKDLQQRAIVNHRLAFNLSTYYAPIWHHTVMPIFYAYPKTAEGDRKVTNAIKVMDFALKMSGTKYVAGDHLTIADNALITSTGVLEAVRIDLTPYPHLTQWYEGFKKNHPDLWAIEEPGMLEMRNFHDNPPDLSHLKHPLHPTDKKALG